MLVHVGIDTVQLKGQPFSQRIAKGTAVRAGDLLTNADLAAIEAAGLETTTIVLVTNPDSFDEVNVVANEGPVSAGDPAILVVA